MNQLQGKAIDKSYTGKPVDHRDIVLSDDDDDDLDKVDTMLHFGGGKFDKANAKERGAYGAGGEDINMGEAYCSRKEELEDRIRRKKMEKVEKMKRKKDQGEFTCCLSSQSLPFRCTYILLSNLLRSGDI